MAQMQLMTVETPTQSPLENWNKIHDFDMMWPLDGMFSMLPFIPAGGREWRKETDSKYYLS